MVNSSLSARLRASWCGERDLPRLRQFIGQYWSHGHIYLRDDELFRWLTYDENEERYDFLLVSDVRTSEIESMVGVSSHRHYDPELAFQDIALHLAKVRGRPHGWASGRGMVSWVITTLRPRSVYMIGITPLARNAMRRFGMTVGRMNHYFQVNARRRRFGLIQKWNPSDAVSGDISSTKSLRPCFPAEFPCGLPELRYSQVPGKSLAYLRRRYLEHPRYSYELLVLSDGGDVQGICVIRRVTFAGAAMLKWVDYYGVPTAIRGTRALWQDLLEKHDAEYVEHYQWGWPAELLTSAGFTQRQSGSSTIVPTYFEPFHPRNVDLDFAFWTESPTASPFVLFRGDADQDRPSA